LFLSTNISKNVVFLSEIGFEMDSSNGTVTDIERLAVQYVKSPWLKIGMGRFHTALGYWNDNYHHGSWLHVTADRPLAYHFEDDNGILPTHAEGLEIRGEGDMGSGQLGYIFNVANGRGPRVDPPQVVNDGDSAKAANLLLYYTMPELGNLRVGAVYYSDTLPGCSIDPAAPDECGFTGTGATMTIKGHEKITGIHLAYAPGNLEAIMEYFVLDHTFDSGETDAKVNAGYAQVSYSLGDWTPYFRYDLVEVPDKKLDAYTNLQGKTTANVLGVRFELDTTSALKFEMTDKQSVDIAQNKTKNRDLVANWSFTF
jgi:hypothetical protein